MTTTPLLSPIPQPAPTPVLGNLRDVDSEKGVFGLMELAERHGPIYRLKLPGRDLVVVSSQELVDELCDESRFDKLVHAPLREVREFAGDGLFTADTTDPNWGTAHRVLMPAFGPAALRGMTDGMIDIAEQLLLKWERYGPEHPIDVGDDATRLTLDTIALCSFSYRFNSFYSEQMHPFIGALARDLVESGARTQRLPLQNRLMLRTRHRYEQDKQLMFEVADQIIAHRRSHPLPDGQHDILDTMLSATDPVTGARLSDENVRYQLVTFLIAGHETTSGLLTFAMHELLSHPDVLARARAEVDEVVGDEAPRFEHLARLPYLDQIFKETLRLWPTAPAFALKSLEAETTLGGRYPVRRDQTLLVLIPGLHRDPAVWGDDPERFDPDRFAFDRAQALPPNAWKPFGNGQRSCIGRGFALQETTLFLAMMLQRFDISPADPDYELAVKHTLTIKPAGLFVHARRRDRTILATRPAPEAAPDAVQAAEPNGIGVQVLYGSNAGSAQAFAQRIANDARLRGYAATLGTLDSAVGQLSTEGPVVVVTSSYEGQPPDNAREFVSWLRELPTGALDDVHFAVFGCGNTDWARTYQAVPTDVDAQLARTGAQRLVERGEADARGDFFGAFDDWYSGFWGKVGAAFGQDTGATAAAPLLEVEFVPATREPLLRQNRLELGTVVANRELVDVGAPGARSKRHLEIALPAGTRYRAGDYLAVLPRNPAGIVERALRRFGLTEDARTVLRIADGGHTFLPANTPIAAGELLSGHVELSQPATRRQIEELAAATPCPPDAQALLALTADPAYAREVLDRRVTVLDLLDRHAACQLTFAAFLQMLGPLTPRQYSISSSPRWNEEHATLTVAVLSGDALSGAGTFEGTASTYLAQARPGTPVAVTVRPSNVAFHPPESLQTPLVLVCAGSGIAPFRGFLQDRALQAQEQGVAPAPALLFFGCDHPDVDHLYRDELAAWAEQGVVDVRPAYSAAPVDGAVFVQDRLWADRAEVADLFARGATFFVCGDGRRMAPSVYDTCARIYAEATGTGEAEAQAWMESMQHDHGRYVADVFA